ncbi:MAG: B12-binding domain-containing radical SAM protein [Candidatus Schekmanbacteria bacterium]|nr:B12-binding domain-containing radical SAM protein [Candidatus Schekmanbacteria bacterium]
MKVCLINPPLSFVKSVGPPFVFHPTGLAYVAASLEKEHEVIFLDACAEGIRNTDKLDDRYYLGLKFDQIADYIRDIKPDVVGISVAFYANVFAGLKTAATVKAVDKNIITILGGPHPSIKPLETLAHPEVDYVVINEGELTALDLLRKIEQGKLDELHTVRGIGFKVNGQPVLTPPREFNAELDSLPFPARHLLPMELYHQATKFGLKSREVYNTAVGKKDASGNVRAVSMITSRGCPFTCNFCSIHLTMGHEFRKRSAENVVAEIEELVAKHNITHIDFEDDNLTFDKKRAARIFDLIIEKGLNISWSTPNGIRADVVDENLVIKMKKSGCVRVFVAPESGVPDVVKNIINKNMNLEKVTQAVRLFAKHGIIVDASFVLGSVGANGRCETKWEMLKTIIYAKKLKILGASGAGFNIAIPLFGTKLRQYAEEGNFQKLAPDGAEGNQGRFIIETPQFTYKELKVMAHFGDWVVNYTFRQKVQYFFRDLFKMLKFVGG